MVKQPKRIIEDALFEGEIGPVSAERLTNLPEEKWGMLRQMITDARRGKPPRDIANCLMCGSPVYIQSRMFQGQRLPLYAHYSGGDENCPWFTGKPREPDAVRADQYQGNQESMPHRMLCNRIAQLASADERHIRTAVASYLPPTENDHGRYPDVLIEWERFPPFVVELQLSHTFQTEVSDRCLHYKREGMPLIWVLYGIDPTSDDIPQSFRDVIVRHRNNAFVISAESIRESVHQSTLVFGCYLRRMDGNFEPVRMVRVDELTFPEKGLPFFEDRLTPRLLAGAQELRETWWSALKSYGPDKLYEGQYSGAFNRLNEALCRDIPGLKAWQSQKPDGLWLFIHLLAVVFAVVSHAQGRFFNFATRQPNAVAMLNSKLPYREVAPFSNLIATILRRTAASDLLKTTVANHLERGLAAAEGELVTERDAPWRAVEKLLPEVFDGVLRRELDEIGTLPSWAVPGR
jgi:hypothetical protein